MLTRDELVARCLFTLDEQAGVFFESENIVKSIQQGYDEIYSLIRPRIKVHELALIPKRVYYPFRVILDDYIHPVGIYTPRHKRWLFFTSTEELDQGFKSWELDNGHPSSFAVIDDSYVAIHPRPNIVGEEDVLHFYYRSSAPVLAAQTAIDIAEMDQNILEHFVVMDSLEQLEEFQKADIHKRDYVLALEELRKHIDKREAIDMQYRLAMIAPGT